MALPRFPFRALTALALLCAAVIVPGLSLASITPVAAAPGIRLHPVDEVMSEFTERDAADRLFFIAPDGSRSRLITSIEDPEISNRGAGDFFPAATEDVEAALAVLPSEFLQELEVEIFVLPYPRSGQLASSATDGAIFLSPGVRQLEPRHVHFLIAHEIGHAVHRHFMPDAARLTWAQFEEVRGISDESRFNENAAHAFRPHEIFAEDFRVLFGGVIASGDGTVENTTIAAPEAVDGLRSFFVSLLAPSAPSLADRIQAAPNPVRPGGVVTLASSRGGRATIALADLVDVSGRSLGSLEPIRDGSVAARLQMPRTDRIGRELAAGAYWVRVRFADGNTASVPLRLVR